MNITQIRNATLKICYHDVKLLTDPWLMPKDFMPGFESAINSNIRQPRTELPMPIESIVDVDAVIITHIHPDHWDEFAERALDKQTKIFVQNECDRDFIKSKGFVDVEILSADGTYYRGITFYKTKTQHGKREVVKPLCEAIGMPYYAMGVILKASDEKTLYIAGDTIWCEEVKWTLSTYSPDVIIINCCEATILNGERLIMGLDDLKELIKNSPQLKIIASHLDTVSHLKLTRADLRYFKEQEQADNLLIPDDGETICIQKAD